MKHLNHYFLLSIAFVALTHCTTTPTQISPNHPQDLRALKAAPYHTTQQHRPLQHTSSELTPNDIMTQAHNRFKNHPTFQRAVTH
ncbi:MAG: hypothetical protein CMF51_01330 [Legionellales bacterium]|nr:hypothetical protein [Legionellales bacterium]